MFDDKNENENWDNIEIDDINTSGEPSWDDILDNAVVQDDQDGYGNNANNANPNPNSSYYAEQDSQSPDYDYNQAFDVVDEEPVVETSTQSRETGNVSEIYNDVGMQQNGGDDYSSFEAGVYQEQQAQSVQGEQDSQYYNAQADTNKPIGIKQDKSGSPVGVILGIVVAIVLAVIVYLLFGYLKSNNLIPSNNNTNVQTSTEQNEFSENSEENLFNEEGPAQNNPDNANNDFDNNNNSAGYQEEPQAPAGDKVVVNVVNGGRSNPFTPTGNFSEAGYTVPKGLDIMGPPPYDKETTPNQLVDIVVSGILYDNTKPSAIITIGGIDHFVQRGDSIDEYIVSYIGPSSVTIRSGKNTYTASIGQQFNVNDRIQGETTYVKGKNGVTRQYFTPSTESLEND